MKADFTFDEMVYNEIVAGRKIWYGEELKVISYVKWKKDIRQVQVHCECGDVFLANQDDVITFEVNKEKPHKKPNRKKLKRWKR